MEIADTPTPYIIAIFSEKCNLNVKKSLSFRFDLISPFIRDIMGKQLC